MNNKIKFIGRIRKVGNKSNPSYVFSIDKFLIKSGMLKENISYELTCEVR